jgi:cytochrome c peroxidase
MIKPILLSLLSTSLLFGSSLQEKAKKNKLLPIPSDSSELSKIIDPKGVINAKRVALGKQLFFEPRLSKSGLISCNFCHNLGMGGVDGVSKAIGHQWRGNPMHLNSPTVYNAVFAKSQFWDGRAPDLETQAGGPIQAAPEMAAPAELVEKRINSIPEYVQLFKEAYSKDVKIDFEKIASTIAIFERILITPSRYDKFLNGEKEALTKAEKEGLNTFIDKGCTTCHNGIALGGEMQLFELRDKYKHRDVGGFRGDAKGQIKVPTLRNITETAPYFHNGMIWSLREAIKEMSHIQVAYKAEKSKKDNSFNIAVKPIDLTDNDIDSILTFLKALEGEKPKITYPQLPKSNDNTPKPDSK